VRACLSIGHLAVRAGTVVPVKFSLDGYQGLSILAAGSPASTPLACDAGASPTPRGDPDGRRPRLTYDAATDTYIYAWKTSTRWTGCRSFVLTLADGTAHHADFRFVR